jgi:hypothetical protein
VLLAACGSLFINPEPLNLELLNDYKCEPKPNLLPEEYTFLKQKKSIPSAAVRRDGLTNSVLS